MSRETILEVGYKGRHIAWQRVDMIVDRRVILEIKATGILPAYAKRQLVNYLHASRIYRNLFTPTRLQAPKGLVGSVVFIP